MNLKKSREIIKLNIKEAGNKMPPDVKMALIIAVEAEDIVILQQELWGKTETFTLPSETED